METLVLEDSLRVSRSAVFYGSNTVQEFDFPACVDFPPLDVFHTVAAFRITPAPTCLQNGVVAASEDYVTTSATELPKKETLSAVDSAMAGLGDLVKMIRQGGSMPVNASIDDLLSQAVLAQGAPRDIQDWARQLSADAGELTD